MTTTISIAEKQDIPPTVLANILKVTLAREACEVKTYNLPLDEKTLATLKPLRRPLRREKPAK